mmetsp:Transcript_23969/g.18297  ORF Transcript_23969/g.18297 Transcript_23969/m.18297 type:complete len:114 (-) Transcript_23969:35-376(-)
MMNVMVVYMMNILASPIRLSHHIIHGSLSLIVGNDVHSGLEVVSNLVMSVELSPHSMVAPEIVLLQISHIDVGLFVRNEVLLVRCIEYQPTAIHLLVKPRSFDLHLIHLVNED